jgi:ABC-2 type transport system ATP-binding protein
LEKTSTSSNSIAAVLPAKFPGMHGHAAVSFSVMEHAIVIENLVIRYGAFTAVDDLSLAIGTGEVFGLLGPNGAGKTTTFSCLTRQVAITSGRVTLLGCDVERDFAAVKPRFGYVPDVENHFDEFTAWQNLRIYADLYGVPRDRIDECLQAVELLREKDLPVRAYSKGMRKKLLLARELLHRPELLLLDEPTANLDVHSTELIRHIIKDLAKRNVTVLITTHNMHEVEEVCDRVAIINHGRLVDLDSPTAFKARNTERIVDVVLQRAAGHEKLVVDLTKDDQRRALAHILESETPITLHTREFNFYQVFLRLTGEDFN